MPSDLVQKLSRTEVRDLVEAAIRTVMDERREEVRELAASHAVERVIDVLNPETRPPGSNCT